MDKLDQEIEEARRRRDEAKRLFEQLETEVRILERAASLRPSVGQPQPHGAAVHRAITVVRKGGKPPGAISMAWRKVLAAIDASDVLEIPSPPEIYFEEATRQGLDTSLASVRDRLKFFESQGYVSGNQLTGYRVTAHAREKLGLDKLEGASPDMSEEAP